MKHPFLLLAVAWATVGTTFAEEVYIHVTGRVKKPGIHKINSSLTLEELEKACGGWDEFGSPKRIRIIRLSRPSNATTGDPGEPKNEIFEWDQLPRDGQKRILKRDDIIFIPMKYVTGR